MKNTADILIIRTDRIGDVILTIPLAEIIKKKFPASKVSFLIREYTNDLFINHPFVDRTILLQRKNGKILFASNLKKIRDLKFDAAVVASPSFKLALILFLAGIKTRIGTGYRWYSFLFNKKVYEHRKFGTKHELDHNVELLKCLGINFNSNASNVFFNIQSSLENEQKVHSFLTERGIDPCKPIVIVHPGSSGSAIDWPAVRFKELIQLMAQQLNCSILVTGSQQEFEICRFVSDGTGAENTAGRFDLGGLIALINNAGLLIANSTGPIHIASALGKYVIGFYPRIPSCSSVRWGPYTAKRYVFSPEIGCSNCTRKQCEKLDCMSSISASAVYEKVAELFNRNFDKEN